MEDERIVMLYLKRSEYAIIETEQKYGKYCYAIAHNILHQEEMALQCVSDTWHSAWNSIPPEKPRSLQYFLARITRNIAIDKYRHNHAKKRGAEIESSMEEYWECIPNGDAPIEDEFALKQAINSFLATLDARTRIIFMRRYWYTMSVKDIAHSMHLSASHVNVILHRTRSKFKEYLMKEGIFV